MNPAIGTEGTSCTARTLAVLATNMWNLFNLPATATWLQAMATYGSCSKLTQGTFGT